MMEMNTANYTPPVDKLLTIGEPTLVTADKWPDYLELGLGSEHIPELIRMATDEELNNADGESLEVWAPLHAARALGQLHAEEAIAPLLTLYDEYLNDEWLMEDLARIYGMIGPAAISALAAYIADSSHELYARTYASNALVEIAKMHPETRSECIAIITRQIEVPDENDPEMNAFFISDLADLKATETLPTIKHAFDIDSVDTFIIDWEDVQVEMGLKERKELPKWPLFNAVNTPTPVSPAPQEETYLPASKPSRTHTTTKKTKNKMAKLSRKKNRKRK